MLWLLLVVCVASLFIAVPKRKPLEFENERGRLPEGLELAPGPDEQQGARDGVCATLTWGSFEQRFQREEGDATSGVTRTQVTPYEMGYVEARAADGLRPLMLAQVHDPQRASLARALDGREVFIGDDRVRIVGPIADFSYAAQQARAEILLATLVFERDALAGVLLELTAQPSARVPALEAMLRFLPDHPDVPLFAAHVRPGDPPALQFEAAVAVGEVADAIAHLDAVRPARALAAARRWEGQRDAWLGDVLIRRALEGPPATARDALSLVAARAPEARRAFLERAREALDVDRWLSVAEALGHEAVEPTTLSLVAVLAGRTPTGDLGPKVSTAAKARAAHLLGALSPQQAEQTLLRLLELQDPEVQALAVTELGRVGSVAAVGPLLRWVKSAPGDLARQGRWSIEEIQGRVRGGEIGGLALARAQAGRLSEPRSEGGLSQPEG